MKDVERRYADLELRQDGSLAGVVLRYGEISPSFAEKFVAGAFGDVAAGDVILNVGHDRLRPLARTQGGGLTLEDSATELRLSAVLPATPEATAAVTLIKSRVLRGSKRRVPSDCRTHGGRDPRRRARPPIRDRRSGFTRLSRQLGRRAS